MQYWKIPEQDYKKKIVRQNNCPAGYEHVSSYERQDHLFGKKYIHEYCRKKIKTVTNTKFYRWEIGFPPFKYSWGRENGTTQDIYENHENDMPDNEAEVD